MGRIVVVSVAALAAWSALAVGRAAALPGPTPAVGAAMRGDVEFFDDLALAHEPEVVMEYLNKEEPDHGLNALAAAVAVNQEAAARKILSLGGDAEAEDHDGHTPINRAANMGRVNMVKLLREHGVDVSKAARDGFTPLHRATWGQTEAHSDVVRYLVQDCRVSVDQLDATGVTAAFRAVDRENLVMLNLLLELGANPDFTSKRGDSLLALAIRKQNVEAVEVLLKANADVTREDSKGRNLRKLAKQLRSKKVLELISNAYAAATRSASEL